MNSCCIRLLVGKKEITPPNWKVVLLLCIVMFSGVTSITYVNVFQPRMVMHFGYPETEKGFYVGMISGMMNLGSIIGSLLAGYSSDAKGRRPVLIVSLLITGISNLAFGLATSIYWALALRFTAGFVSAQISVGKTVLYDISDNTNQGVIMSFVMFSYGLGFVFGPLIGGFLADPISQYPNSFIARARPDFLVRFPFLLPGIVVGTFLILSALLLLISFPETKPEKKSAESDCEMEVVQLVPAASSDVKVALNGHILDHDEAVIKSLPDGLYQRANDKEKTPIGASMPLLNISMETMAFDPYTAKDRKKSTVTNEKEGVCSWISQSQVGQICRQSTCMLSMLVYSLAAMCSTAHQSTLPVYLSTPVELDGLNFSPKNIGIAAGLMSVVLTLGQPCIFTALERRFGALRTTMWLSIVNAVTLLPLPLLHNLIHNPIALWICLEGLLIPIQVSFMSMIGALSLVVNNSVEPHLAGTMNGLTTASGCALRFVGAFSSGAIYTWSIQYGYKIGYPFDISMVYICIGLAIFCIVFIICFLPYRLDKQNKK